MNTPDVSQVRRTRAPLDPLRQTLSLGSPVIFVKVLVYVVGTLGLAILSARRVFEGGPAGGDASVWFSLYEWVRRGHLIYSDVWDHKDLGFLWINSLVYATGGAFGVYFFSLSLVGVFAFSIFLITREFAPRYFSFLVAVLLTASYVTAPSFLAVYTEHFAVTLIAFASALLVRFPLTAGAIFAVATSIKVSSIIVPILAVTALLLARKIWLKKTDSPPLRSAIRSSLGFLITGVVILAGAHIANLLPGWVEVISYNREYSSIRNANPLAPMSLLGLFKEVIGGPLAVLTLFVGFAVILLRYLRVGRVEAGSNVSRNAGETLAVAVGVAVGTIIALIPQIPPSFHHFHFAVGGLLILTSALIGSLRLKLSSSVDRNRFFAAAMGLYLMFSVVPGDVTSLVTGGPVLGVDVEYVRTPPTKDADLSWAKSVAIFGSNSPAFDPRALPEHVVLKCRMYYQFSHMIPRYREEIGSCIDHEPDIILMDRPQIYFDNLEGWGFGDLGETLTSDLEASYVQCAVEFGNFRMFARSDDDCRKTLGD